MRRRRRVTPALQVSTNRDEADVGRVAALNLYAAVDVAELGLAASCIVDALKIPADLDAGADKPALLSALRNLNASVHCYSAFEKRGCALMGLNIAVDCRRLLPSVDGETGILQNLHVARDGCVGNRAGRATRHDNVAGDAPA
jgi:hypothetical protein